MSPFVSIVMPAYNAGDYLTASVNSILAQDFNNFELIVIDDGSSDGSIEAICEIDDNRLILIRNECNKGLIYSLNYGCSLAKGEWIARMDADDIALPNRLQEQLAFAEQHALDFLGANATVFGPETNRLLISPSGKVDIEFSALFKCPFIHPVVLGRRELFLMGYDEKYKHAEDYELWTRLILEDVKFGNMPKVLLRYREHSNQISVTKRAEQESSFKAALLKYAKIYLPCNYFNKFSTLNFGRSERYSSEDVRHLLVLTMELSALKGASDVVTLEMLMYFLRKSNEPSVGNVMYVVKNIEYSKLGLSNVMQLLYLCFFSRSRESYFYKLARKYMK